jgi:hypothetical protein
MKYDYNYDGNEGIKEFSIKGKYLFHIDSVEAIQDSQILMETLLEGIISEKIEARIINGNWVLSSPNDSEFEYRFAASSTFESKEGLIRDLAVFASQ